MCTEPAGCSYIKVLKLVHHLYYCLTVECYHVGNIKKRCASNSTVSQINATMVWIKVMQHYYYWAMSKIAKNM